MGKKCQCLGDCGYPLCCRLNGRKRKNIQTKRAVPKCDDCRGLATARASHRNQTRKRPAAHVVVAPAAAPDAAATPTRDLAAALNRVATALGSWGGAASTSGASVPFAAGSSSDTPAASAAQDGVTIVVPASLRAWGDAAEAAVDSGRSVQQLLSDLPVNAGESGGRGLCFAACNALLAVLRPTASLRGLDSSTGNNYSY